jgi:hypothetical protein
MKPWPDAQTKLRVGMQLSRMLNQAPCPIHSVILSGAQRSRKPALSNVEGDLLLAHLANGWETSNPNRPVLRERVAIYEPQLVANSQCRTCSSANGRPTSHRTMGVNNGREYHAT